MKKETLEQNDYMFISMIFQLIDDLSSATGDRKIGDSCSFHLHVSNRGINFQFSYMCTFYLCYWCPNEKKNLWLRALCVEIFYIVLHDTLINTVMTLVHYFIYLYNYYACIFFFLIIKLYIKIY